MIGRTISHYKIIEKLGEGGMGVVYKAEDTRLKRFVALKFLNHTAEDDEARRRFVHEARTVSSLEHPHICAIHEIAESPDGRMFIVMPCYEGEALKEKIDRGPLPFLHAVEIARQLASGLARAHEKGVVHRDIKPANILVTQDGVKIVDFGLAKLRMQTRLTREGTTMGTVMYMSPEQARAEETDERSDIWSLGVILYEMIAGRPPFTGEHEQSIIYLILNESPERLGSISSGVPEALERIVMRALTKNPGERYQKMTELLADLDGAIEDLRQGMKKDRAPGRAGWRRAVVGVAGLAVVTALALGPGRALWQRPLATAEEESVRIAVLPFDHQGIEADEYFTAGITDEVRARLTRVPGLSVIARTSSNDYRKTRKSPQEISKELGVDYLLTGAVRFAMEADGMKRVRVSPELVVGSSAESKWAQPFDATLTDVFRVQGEIAARVAQALDLALSAGSKKQLAEQPTQNMAAYEAYLRGEDAWEAGMTNDPPRLRVAIEQYERAVALDDTFLKAWAQLSRASTLLYINGQPTPALASRARESADKAVALDPNRPEGHLALGVYLSMIELDRVRALSEIERARALAPGDPEYASFTVVEQSLGRWEEALRQLEEARRLDPRSVVTLRRLGDTALWLRRTAEAREAMDAALALKSDQATVEAKAMTYLQEGDLAGARAVLSSAAGEVEPTSLVAYTALYWDLVWALDEAQQDLLLRLSPSAFDNDRGGWGLSFAQAYELRQDEANVRKYAEIAYTAFAEQLAEVPEDAQRNIMVGLSLAYLGRNREAIESAERAVELLPASEDAWMGAYLQHQLVRVYTMTGEHEKALDQLEALMKIPYYLTPRWLAIDPNFAPLKGNPRFEALLRQAA